MMSAEVVVVVAALGLSGCSNGAGNSAADSAADSMAESCDPATTEAASIVGAEARADASDGHEVWALFFNHWPLPPGDAARVPVDDEVKIVWRSTGADSFAVVARGPGGALLEPTWGPEPHSSSNWERPGQEWGTGWIFPATGCWTFEVSHGDAAARLVTEVFASPSGSPST